MTETMRHMMVIGCGFGDLTAPIIVLPGARIGIDPGALEAQDSCLLISAEQRAVLAGFC
jgi:hypothetical protein